LSKWAIIASGLLEWTPEDGTDVRRDELSRVLGTFVDKGWVHVVSGDQGRKKFFALTPVGRGAMESVLAHASAG